MYPLRRPRLRPVRKLSFPGHYYKRDRKNLRRLPLVLYLSPRWNRGT
jgi:hypothetical protein